MSSQTSLPLLSTDQVGSLLPSQYYSSTELRNRFSHAAEHLGNSFYSLTKESQQSASEDDSEDLSGGASSSPSTKQTDVMACRDRTLEFSSTIQSLHSRQTLNGFTSPLPKDTQKRSNFTLVAKKIGHDLASTFAKLEKLTVLAKRKSLFDDRPLEIQELTYIIKQDINSLNKQIAHLQQMSHSDERKNKHLQSHSSTVVVGLQSRLASMSSNFKSVLDVRTENLKSQKGRRDQFSQNTSGVAALPPSTAEGYSILLQDEEHATSVGRSSASGAVSIDMPLQPTGSRHSQQMQLIEETDAYIKERATTMESIEHVISELSGIFTQLATMVKEQEETVLRIDSNVEETSLNINAAHSEILKYFQSVSSNRWLMVKVFGVLIVFFILFVIFLA